MTKESTSSSIKNVAEAIEAVTKAVPIYEDAVQPAAKQLGKSLETITKTVNVALAPLELVVWGYDQIKGFISDTVSQKLDGTPEEDIISPKISIAGPAIEALRFVADEEALREMYANLLANAMDRKTAELTHPAFVEILKNMNSDEAKIMKYFSNKSTLPLINIGSSVEGSVGTIPYIRNFTTIGEDANCEVHLLTPNYLDNLERLGLIKIKVDSYLADENTYNSLINHTITEEAKAKFVSESREIEIDKGYIGRTDLGIQFCNSCVIDKKSS